MKINTSETKIVGHWIFEGSKRIADEKCQRINWLTTNYLIAITSDQTGWLKLYQDPEDKRYWQLSFENSEMQGGGPPSLILLSEFEVKSIFKI